MIRDETTIKVAEGNDPLLRLRAWVVDQSTQPATRTPYDFTNAQSIEFLVKDGVSTAEADATVYTLTTGVTIVGLPTDGRIDVQVTNEVTRPARNRRYRLDVVRNNKRETVMAGPFIVQDL